MKVSYLYPCRGQALKERYLDLEYASYEFKSIFGCTEPFKSRKHCSAGLSRRGVRPDSHAKYLL